MKKKTLVIINGVTGAIGNACLAEFSRCENVTIIGLSRQARHYRSFMDGEYLAEGSFICSVGDITKKQDCEAFAAAINSSSYARIIYVHAVGLYLLELDRLDTSSVVDGRVVKLTHDAFVSMVEALSTMGKPLRMLIFGGLSDKHHPRVYKSWWTVMERVKARMRKFVMSHENMRFCLLNISSVVCSNEMITRPYVFIKTDAIPRYWLQPHEVSEEVVALTVSGKLGRIVEKDLFRPSDYYHDGYYTEPEFSKRKKLELGISIA